MKGVIIRSLGGFYTVRTEDGDIYDCKPRGVFRKEKTVLVVGDEIEAQKRENDLGVIDALYPRRNLFDRPPIANIDKMFIVIAAANPSPDTLFADKLICICRHKGVEPVIVINKCDLADTSGLRQIYSNLGIEFLTVSAADGMGIDALLDKTKNCLCGFAGFSGVGKSSIISLLVNKAIETGRLSNKLGRGRHTTRHVELYPLDSTTLIADTPGFSSLDVAQCGIRKEDLQFLFPEFEEHLGKCRFTTCAHVKEKGCAVIDAVQSGGIPKSRFESYAALYEQLKLIPDWK